VYAWSERLLHHKDKRGEGNTNKRKEMRRKSKGEVDREQNTLATKRLSRKKGLTANNTPNTIQNKKGWGTNLNCG
jgi:hypothetical protein